MSLPNIQPSFAAGEMAPSLYGRADFAKYHSGLSTCRNLFISYRGGAYSRAGTAFVGFSRQTGRTYPPRLVTFQFNINQGLALEFGHLYMRVIQDGAYVTDTPAAITGAARSLPCVVTQPAHGYANGDWVFISGVGGMTQLNGEIFVVQGVTANTYQLFDAFGRPIDATGFGNYTGGGTGARIFTLVTPWAEADLAYLKWTQSADVMSICCWNQVTNALYAMRELKRVANNNWNISTPTFAPTIGPPAACTVTSTGAGTTNFAYLVTAVSTVDGSESIASPIGLVTGIDIATTAGTNLITWPPVAGAVYYNIYKASETDGVVIPAGSPFGFAGQATGVGFTDSNIVPDFTQTAPTAQNPFNGSGGNYPSVVAYFQQRRVYAATPNNPDTYFMSQPGAFLNFDTRIPTIATDAITGTPWSLQVDGIQFLVQMPGGLVVLTGSSAWQVTGAGGSAVNPQAISPSSQQAQPQAYNGCSSTIPPIKIDYDILYVQAKGSIVRDLSYNYWINIYTGQDITQLSSQLFTGFTMREWAWTEEPNKLVWLVRNDGALLSLTFLKQQEVIAWARHDTYGLFQSVCSVTEPPVDALYCAVSRPLGPLGPLGPYAYTIERMDNRIWNQLEDCWCVDCGLTLVQPTPNATLSAHSAAGLGAPSGTSGLVGGSGYSAGTTAAIVDPTGTGCAATPTVVGGVITAVALAGGSGYTFPQLQFTDPAGTGSGAAAVVTLNNSATFNTNGAVFNAGMVGQVIRVGGGKAVITAFGNSSSVTVNIIEPITQVIAGTDLPFPAPAGEWTLSAPVTVISGLNHLVGQSVTGLADGIVIPLQTVSAQGTITLSTPASAVTVGLPFQAQLQTLYLDGGQPTIQGRRKRLSNLTVRIEASAQLKVGANQPDGAAQSPPVLATRWAGLTALPDLGIPPYGSTTAPLFTGDVRIQLSSAFDKRGQVAIQQDNPLPMQILAVVSEALPGDLPEEAIAPREAGPQMRRAA